MDTLDRIAAHIDKTGGPSLDMQLATAVSKVIRDGILGPGDALPDERELCDALSLPRSIVRQALETLRTSGEIYRMSGVGTFVSPQYMRRQLGSVYNFTDAVRAGGMKPRSEVLSFERTYPAGFSSRTLDLPTDHPSIFRIERLRRADGLAVSLEIEHIPCWRFEGLEKADLTGSLYRVLEEGWGVEVGDADEYYQAVLLTKKVAAKLGRQHRSAAFRIVRVVRDTEGEVFDITEAFVPADSTRLGVHLVGKGSPDDYRLPNRP